MLEPPPSPCSFLIAFEWAPQQTYLLDDPLKMQAIERGKMIKGPTVTSNNIKIGNS